MDKTDDNNKVKSNEQSKYKTVRIYPGDFEYLRNLAFYNNTKIVNCISNLIRDNKKKVLEEKMEAIKSLFFTDDNHKEIFIKYVENFPLEAKSKDNLVIFYMYAAAGIYNEKITHESVKQWDGNFTKDSSNELFLLNDKYQQIVKIANLLLNKNDKEDVCSELIKVDYDLRVVATEMIRLSLYNLDEIIKTKNYDK